MPCCTLTYTKSWFYKLLRTHIYYTGAFCKLQFFLNSWQNLYPLSIDHSQHGQNLHRTLTRAHDRQHALKNSTKPLNINCPSVFTYRSWTLFGTMKGRTQSPHQLKQKCLTLKCSQRFLKMYMSYNNLQVSIWQVLKGTNQNKIKL